MADLGGLPELSDALMSLHPFRTPSFATWSLSPWTVAVASRADSSWKDWRALELQPWSTWGCSWGLTSHKMGCYGCLISITMGPMGIKKDGNHSHHWDLLALETSLNQWQVEKTCEKPGVKCGFMMVYGQWNFCAVRIRGQSMQILRGPGGISDFRIPLVIQCLSAQARCMEFHVPRDTPVDVLRSWLKMFSLIYWF